MSPLHKVTKAYWDAFYTGMMAVGLPPKERPAFKAKNDTESETMRCMRQALQVLREPPQEAYDAASKLGLEIDRDGWQVVFDAIFPEPVKPRRKPLTGNDMGVQARAKRKFG
jgi:hypothetical protein